MIRVATWTVILALCVTAWTFADVKVKAVDISSVQITFTYKDDVDSEVGLIGSFDNWTVPGEAMAKNAAGLWEKTITAAPTDEITYKFYSKGTWIVDDNAPDQKDDGYGGHNGLIVVADILSGAVSATPVKAGTPAKDAPAAEKTYNSKLAFGMYTVVGSRTAFSTQGVVDKTQKGLEADDTGLYSTSYWKIDGTILPGIRTFINMNVANGYQELWAQDARGVVNPTAAQGFAGLAAGLVTNPIAYLSANTNPTIDTVKIGVEGPWVKWETGGQYAKPDDHSGFLWTTLYQQSANNGYMRFDLGKDLQKVGDFTVESTVGPNLMTGNYGVFSWLSVTHPLGKLEFEYDAKSAESSLLSKIFNKLYHQDYLVAAKTKVAGIDLTAQGLVNQFSESPYDNNANLAGEVKASYSLPGNQAGITAGYRFTGTGATLLFGNNDDSFGTKGVQKGLVNLWGQLPGTPVKGGVDTAGLLSVAASSNGLEYYAKPWTEFDLQGLFGNKSSVNTYVKTYYNFQPTLQQPPDNNPLYLPTSTSVQVTEIGSKFALANPLPGTINQMYVTYGYNGWEQAKVMHTLVTSLTLPQNLWIDVGLGYRAPRDYSYLATNNYYAFSLQASWRVPVPAIRNPLLYGAFVYNMDPYDSDTNNLQMDDNIPDGGTTKSDGKAKLRVMMKWDF